MIFPQENLGVQHIDQGDGQSRLQGKYLEQLAEDLSNALEEREEAVSAARRAQNERDERILEHQRSGSFMLAYLKCCNFLIFRYLHLSRVRSHLPDLLECSVSAAHGDTSSLGIFDALIAENQDLVSKLSSMHERLQSQRTAEVLEQEVQYNTYFGAINGERAASRMLFD